MAAHAQVKLDSPPKSSTCAALRPSHTSTAPPARSSCARLEPGRGLFWLGGFMSDMTGAKAAALAEMARSDGRSFLRFDYSGHGASGGSFEEQTLSNWLEDAS